MAQTEQHEAGFAAGQAELYNRDQALKFVRTAKGKKLFVRGSTFLEVSREGDKRRGFDDMSCYLPVSKSLATKYISDILSEGLAARGARIRIKTSSDSRCTFIGGL